MSAALERVLRELSGHLDAVRGSLPPHYSVTLVCRHRTDTGAHIIIGKDGPEAALQAIQETLTAPNRRRGFADVGAARFEQGGKQ